MLIYITREALIFFSFFLDLEVIEFDAKCFFFVFNSNNIIDIFLATHLSHLRYNPPRTYAKSESRSSFNKQTLQFI